MQKNDEVLWAFAIFLSIFLAIVTIVLGVSAAKTTPTKAEELMLDKNYQAYSTQHKGYVVYCRDGSNGFSVVKKCSFLPYNPAKPRYTIVCVPAIPCKRLR